MDGKPVIAITAGDVAGIGPEIVVQAAIDASVRHACFPLVICHPEILRRATRIAGIQSVQIRELSEQALKRGDVRSVAANELNVITCLNPQGDHALNAESKTVSAAAGEAAYRYLICASDLARNGVVDAITTAPLNKAALHAAGYKLPGHTEILANECGVEKFAMMLHLPETRLADFRRLIAGNQASQDSRFGVSIAHVTLHTSVKSVPQLLTEQGIRDGIHLVHDFLTKIGCDRRAIAVCALNPHGGESGLFGDEEGRLIGPAVRKAIAEGGLNASGPLPVDTLMRRAFGGEFDGVVAMYHDQGHIPVKLIGFDSAVNITLGLPMVRTSPTHGTAFDRAWGSGPRVDPRGMIEAILTAAKLSDHRQSG